jgi:hypothetical protein
MCFHVTRSGRGKGQIRLTLKVKPVHWPRESPICILDAVGLQEDLLTSAILQ